MIWRVMRPDLNWTFKETRNSKPNKTLYSKEVKELENLANNFKTVSTQRLILSLTGVIFHGVSLPR